jgi:hypothetical protein
MKKNEPAIDGPQARTASRAAAVEQCCIVSVQYCGPNTGNDSPRGRIEGGEISHEASSVLARMPLRGKCCRLVETPASPHVNSARDQNAP